MFAKAAALDMSCLMHVAWAPGTETSLSESCVFPLSDFPPWGRAMTCCTLVWKGLVPQTAPMSRTYQGHCLSSLAEVDHSPVLPPSYFVWCGVCNAHVTLALDVSGIGSRKSGGQSKQERDRRYPNGEKIYYMQLFFEDKLDQGGS